MHNLIHKLSDIRTNGKCVVENIVNDVRFEKLPQTLNNV